MISTNIGDIRNIDTLIDTSPSIVYTRFVNKKIVIFDCLLIFLNINRLYVFFDIHLFLIGPVNTVNFRENRYTGNPGFLTIFNTENRFLRY